MGCDIHLYVEATRYDRWWPFAGRMNPGRDYELFGLLAGVRGDGCLIQPRGLPPDVGWAAHTDNYLWINHASDTAGDGTVTAETAKRYHKQYERPYLFQNGSDRPSHVAHPDWHNHSWLTAEEFAKCVESCQRGCGAAYHAVVAAMRELDKRGEPSRVVFWFDN